MCSRASSVREGRRRRIAGSPRGSGSTHRPSSQTSAGQVPGRTASPTQRTRVAPCPTRRPASSRAHPTPVTGGDPTPDPAQPGTPDGGSQDRPHGRRLRGRRPDHPTRTMARRAPRSQLLMIDGHDALAGEAHARQRGPANGCRPCPDPIGLGAGGTPGGQHTGVGASGDEPAPPDRVGHASLRSVAARSHPVR
jgi:hypothetical protein